MSPCLLKFVDTCDPFSGGKNISTSNPNALAVANILDLNLKFILTPSAAKFFLFMGNMSPYYFKTTFTLCMKCMPSFIKIGGAVSEKNDHIRQTFVVLYIGLS